MAVQSNPNTPDALSRFGVIVLAAGLSSRMGGPNKLLQPYRGVPLLTYALRTVSALGFADSLVVTGRDAAAVAGLASASNIRALHHEGFAAGLGSSIAFGASQIKSPVEGVFVALGDMPHVRTTDYERAAGAFRKGAIVIPVYGGQRGHPILFCAVYLNELAALSGDTGGRAVISRHFEKVVEVEAGHEGVLQDFDAPEDFWRWTENAIMTRKAINDVPGIPKALGPYSRAVWAGDLLYASGQTGVSAETGHLVEGVAEQTRQTLENLAAVFKAAGLTLDDAIKSNVYLTDMADFTAMNDVYATFFSDPKPSRTTVAVSALPGGAKVEIELVGYSDKSAA